MPSAKKHLVISGTVLAIAAIALVTALSFVLAEASVTNEAYYTFVETEGYNQNGYSTLREYTLTTQRPQGVENEDYYVLDMSSGSSDYPMWRESDGDTENRLTIASPMAPACTRYLFSEIDVINGLSNLSMENVENASCMFYYYRGAGALDLSSWGADMGNVQDVSAMFCNAPHITELNLSNWDLRSVTSTSGSASMLDLRDNSTDTAIETIVLDGWKPGSGIIPSRLVVPCYNNASEPVEVSFDNWDLGSLTSLSDYFNGMQLANLDLSTWDVSNIETMDRMFFNSGTAQGTPGTLDISGWNLASIVSAVDLCSSGNSWETDFHWHEVDMHDWTVPDTASTTAIAAMAGDVLARTGLSSTSDAPGLVDMSCWDISGVSSTSGWFADTYIAGHIEIDCSDWNAPDLITTENMFSNMTYAPSLDISGWTVPALENTSNMFERYNDTNDGSSVTVNITGWTEITELTNMSEMFAGACFDTLSIGGWELSSPDSKIEADMSQMFARAHINGSELDLSPLASCFIPTSMSSLLRETATGDSCAIDISGFDLRSCTDMSEAVNIYSGGSIVLAMDDWIVGDSTDVGGMFSKGGPYCSTLDLSSWTLDGVTDISNWFNGQAESWLYADDIPYYISWDETGTYDLADGVENKKVFIGSSFGSSSYGWISSVETLNLANWDVSGVVNFAGLLANFGNLKTLDLTGWDMSSAKYTDGMFYGCSSLESIDLSEIMSGATLESASEMFSSCPNLEEVCLDNVTFTSNTEPLYQQDSNIITGYRQTEYLPRMFYYDDALARIYLNQCTVDHVTGDSYEDSATFIILSDMEAEKKAELYANELTLKGNVGWLFYSNSLASVHGVETWNTDELEDAPFLLAYMPGVENIDLTGWDVSNVTSAVGMLSYLPDTQTINISGLSWDSVEDVTNMFSDSYNLATIYVSEGTDWYAEALASPTKFHSGQSSVENLQYIQVFPNPEYYDDEGMPHPSSLVGSKGTALATVGDSSLRYARVDGLGDQPGYFTAYVPPTTVGDVQAELDSIEYADVSADGYDIPSDRYWTTSQERAAIDEAVQNTETALSSEPASGELAELLTALRTAHAAYDAAKKPGLAVSAHIRHEMKTSAAVDAGGIAYAVTAEPITALSPEHIAEGGRPVPASIAPAPITITPAAAAATESSDEYAKAFETDIIAQVFFGDAALFELPGVYFFALAESHGGGSSDDAAKWSYGGERYMMRVYIENDPASQGRLKYSSISLRALDAQGGEGADKAAEATFTSSYTGWQTLTVTKKVEGDFANKQLDFDFRVTLYLPSWFDAQARDVGLGNAALSSAPARSGDAGPYTGIYTASLHNDESATFEVPVGTYYKIEEIGAPPDTGIPYDTDIEWAVSL